MVDIERKLVELMCATQGRDFSQLDHPTLQALLDLPINDLKLDSLERMEFVMGIEEHYSIELNERDIIACTVLRHYAKLIAPRLGKTNSDAAN